jgi:chorismate mutase
VTSTLDQLRADLDATDVELIEVVARRFALCRSIAETKRREQIPMMQPQRIEHVKRRCVQMGVERGLSAEFVVALYDVIIAEACRVEDDVMSMR